MANLATSVTINLATGGWIGGAAAAGLGGGGGDDDAGRAINAVLPLVNGAGATAHHIREAVSQIDPTATRIGSSPIPPSEGPLPVAERQS